MSYSEGRTKEALLEKYIAISGMLSDVKDDEIVKKVPVSLGELKRIKEIERAMSSAKGNVELSGFTVTEKMVEEFRVESYKKLAEEFCE